MPPPLEATFGISRSHGGEGIREAARNFAQRLSAMSAIDVRCVVEADYEALFSALKQGQVSMAWLPPLLYSRAAVEGMTLAAVPERSGAVAIYSAILVGQKAPHRDAGALSAVRAAWVDRSSASGYAFPRQYLLSTGATFASETFHGSPNVAAAQVAAGQADVCTCPVSTKELAEAQPYVEQVLGPMAAHLRVLAISGMISPDGIALSMSAPPALARELAGAVLRLHKDNEGRSAIQDLFRAERMVSPAESTRRMMDTPV